MFHIQTPVLGLDVQARARVYREFVHRHRELQDINVGSHNDMIILAEDTASGAKSAVLVATGTPGARVDFPLHLHEAGEIQVCLEGTYGEALPPDTCIDDLFEYGTTLQSFQGQFPGVVEVVGGREIRLGPGAGWNFVGGSQHQPFGWIGPNGLLLAQIYWPGPTRVLSAART